jgi:hypothetical protein
MAGMFAVVFASFVLMSLYLTGDLTSTEITQFFGIS